MTIRVLNFNSDIEPLQQDRRLAPMVDLLKAARESWGDLSEQIEIADPSIQQAARKNAKRMGDDLSAALGRAYREQKRNGPNPLLPKDARKFRSRLLGTDGRHAFQAHVLGSLSGAWGYPRLHVFDACGGNGVTANTIAHCREKGFTTGTVIDRDPKNSLKFTAVHAFLAPDAALEIRTSDIKDFRLRHEGPSVCVAKHACGPAADLIMRNVARVSGPMRPRRSAILTCCHGNLEPHHAPNGIKGKLWSAVSGMADISPGYRGLPLEAALISRYAMQLVDTTRAAALPDNLQTQVVVAFSSDISRKNHVIIISNRA